MNKYIKVLKNEYFDSVTLMSLTAKLKSSMSVQEMVILMATEMNVEMIEAVGLGSDEVKAATPNDLVIGVMTEEDGDAMIDEIIEQLKNNGTKSKKKNEVSYKTQRAALSNHDLNITVISVPGAHAAREARIALENDLHVMMFSDNVTVEDEVSLKSLARDKGLLMMGPDCGTSIINNKGLCFANNVKKGPIGLVAASGTGLQEVTVIIDNLGGGITQAIGVGGRDLKAEVGGIMMIEGIKALNEDPETQVIVLISKPPAKSVEAKILDVLSDVNKPVVVCFLDGDKQDNQENQYFVTTLAEAATTAMHVIGLEAKLSIEIDERLQGVINEEKRKLNSEQSYLRGLYCGGTLCAEALSIARQDLQPISSNVAKKEYEVMKDPLKSEAHALVDLGDDLFTNGKPHPMIEPMIRLERIVQEAKDPSTGVILLDFELGFGSHEDPVGVTISSIKKAQEIAKQDGRHISFVGYVCGTQTDKQGYSRQKSQLEDAGVIVGNSNAQAVKIAIEILKEVQ